MKRQEPVNRHQTPTVRPTSQITELFAQIEKLEELSKQLNYLVGEIKIWAKPVRPTRKSRP